MTGICQHCGKLGCERACEHIEGSFTAERLHAAWADEAATLDHQGHLIAQARAEGRLEELAYIIDCLERGQGVITDRASVLYWLRALAEGKPPSSAPEYKSPGDRQRFGE